jgi:Cu/Ag efflux protein CusF
VLYASGGVSWISKDLAMRNALIAALFSAVFTVNANAMEQGGVIVSVDRASKTFTVRWATADRTYIANDKMVIRVGQKKGAWSDLKTGTKVNISFHPVEGNRVAYRRPGRPITRRGGGLRGLPRASASTICGSAVGKRERSQEPPHVATKNDAAYAERNRTYDDLQRAVAAFDEVRNLPEDHPNRKGAAANLQLRWAANNAAAGKIAPALGP